MMIGGLTRGRPRAMCGDWHRILGCSESLVVLELGREVHWDPAEFVVQYFLLERSLERLTLCVAKSERRPLSCKSRDRSRYRSWTVGRCHGGCWFDARTPVRDVSCAGIEGGGLMSPREPRSLRECKPRFFTCGGYHIRRSRGS